ncbi:hypothetical protein J7L87_01990 [bacterium]|nr:hypothetical protein [bacterium]
MFRKKANLKFIFIGVGIVFLILIGIVIGFKRPFTLYLLFEKKPNVNIGDKILMNEVPVGEIEKIVLKEGKVALMIKIYPDYKDMFTENTKFIVKRERLFPSSQKICVIPSHNLNSRKLRNGETVFVKLPESEFQKKVKDVFKKMGEMIKKDMEKLKKK